MKLRRLTLEEKEYLKDHPKAVVCLETQEIFTSAVQASRTLGISYGTILYQLRGRRKSPVEGYTFEYLERMRGRRF